MSSTNHSLILILILIFRNATNKTLPNKIRLFRSHTPKKIIVLKSRH